MRVGSRQFVVLALEASSIYDIFSKRGNIRTGSEIALQQFRQDVGNGDGFGVFGSVTADLTERPGRCRLDVILHFLRCQRL